MALRNRLLSSKGHIGFTSQNRLETFWKLRCSQIAYIRTHVRCSARSAVFWAVAFSGEIFETFLDSLAVVHPVSLVHCRTCQLHIVFLDIDTA